jgi:hypothetical protein
MDERLEMRNFSSARTYEKRPLWQAGFFDDLLRNDESYTKNENM